MELAHMVVQPLASGEGAWAQGAHNRLDPCVRVRVRDKLAYALQCLPALVAGDGSVWRTTGRRRHAAATDVA